MEAQVATTKPSFWTAAKYRLALLGSSSLVLVGVSSAAVNFTPIQELLTAVVDLIPTFMDLVVSIAPLVVTIAIISFVIKFLNQIINMLNFN